MNDIPAPLMTCSECHGEGWHHITCSAVRRALKIDADLDPELSRQKRHHDIFKIALGITLERGLESIEAMKLTTPEAVVEMCRKYADLAYPLPSAAKDQT